MNKKLSLLTWVWLAPIATMTISIFLYVLAVGPRVLLSSGQIKETLKLFLFLAPLIAIGVFQSYRYKKLFEQM